MREHILDTLCEGHDFDDIRPQARLLLSNIMDSWEDWSATDLSIASKVVLPVARRVISGMIHPHIVGFQPQEAVDGEVSCLSVHYDYGRPKDEVELGPLNVSDIVLSSPAVAILEGRPGNRLQILIDKFPTSAVQKTVFAKWYLEPSSPSIVDGFDLETEILAALAQAIICELNQELFDHVRQVVGEPTSVYDQSTITGTPTFIGDVHAVLAVLIGRQANIIAARTRRGAGNWAIVSPTALTILQSARTSAFARTAEGSFDSVPNSDFVGTLNGRIKIYVDSYADDNTPVLVGYKGTPIPIEDLPDYPFLQPGEMDSGIIFAPYRLIGGHVPEEETDSHGITTKVMKFFTNNSYLIKPAHETVLGTAQDYFGSVGIKSNSLRFY